MVPPASHRVSRVRRYSGAALLSRLFTYVTLTLFGRPSHDVQLSLDNTVMQSATPKELLLSVWPLSLSLATTQKISVDFSSSPYLDVSVQAVSLVQLCIHCTITEVCSVGLLHSEIHGSMRTYRSPWLIAVNHVLLRLPMPRHSPCALFSFTICFMLFLSSLELLILTCSFLPDISIV